MDRSRARLLGGLTALATLTALGTLSLWSVAAPPPRGADAPAGEFSATRAFAHVERVATREHVAGSAAADDVRAYLQTELGELGLSAQVQDAVGAGRLRPGVHEMARVRNVVAMLAGSAPTGRVFLVAHYDSAQVSFGANDDGAGVATLLETARAMVRGAAPRNDVVFVFTDAEEACLCGAEAFVSQHPLAAAGGVVLNIEARGSSGPAIMFETSPGNAGVVGVYGDAAPHPVATSFAVEVYRILPNDTDFTPFLRSGRFTGLNAAFIDGSAVYHTPQDRPGYLDPASLQHHGDNALALTRAFAATDLRDLSRPSAFDSTYFPALTQLVRYPGWLVWPFAALALLAVVMLAVVATRRGAATWRRAAAGFGLGLVPLVLAPVAAQLLWLLLVTLRPEYDSMIDPWRPQWFRAAVVALVATVLLTWYGLLRRRIGAWSLAIGALGWLAVVGIALAALTPGGSYLAALPALAGAIAATVALVMPRPLVALGVLVVGAAVAVLVLAPTVLLFFPALGLATGGAAALFAVMLGMAALAVLDWLYPMPDRPGGDPAAGDAAGHARAAGDAAGHAPAAGDAAGDAPAGGARRRAWLWLPAFTAAVLTVALLVVGLSVDRFDANRPVATHLMYALDTDTGQARWVSAELDPGEWTSGYVNADGSREDLSSSFPVLNEDVVTGPAAAASLVAPTLSVASDTVSAGERTVSVTLTPARPARFVLLQVEADPTASQGPVVRASVRGRDVAVQEGERGFALLFHAPDTDGVTVTLVLRQAGPVRMRVMDGSDGLDGLPGFRPRPAGVGVLGSHDADLVLVARTYTV